MKMNYMMFPIEMGMDLRAELTPEQERNFREKIESWYGNGEPTLDQIFKEGSDAEKAILFRYSTDLQNPRAKYQEKLNQAERERAAQEAKSVRGLRKKKQGTKWDKTAEELEREFMNS